MEKCDQSNLCFCDTFGMFILYSAIYFLEVIVHLSLKIATNDPSRCKKAFKMGIFDAIILRKNGVAQSE